LLGRKIAMPETSRLVKMKIRNIGCIGPEGCEIALDSILCLVGANNTGKSMILRAYELALGSSTFNPEDDLCKRCGGASATVEIWVHIPRGIANIAEKWKVNESGILLVRSKWEWSSDTKWTKIRTTWDPELNDYATDDKASGLDTVFTSRLPVPFRVGSLDDPQEEHRKLMTLVLQPIAEKLQQQMADDTSDLRTTIARLSLVANVPVEEEKHRLDTLKQDLNRSHNAIFPELTLDFDINIGEVEINPLQMLVKNSKLRFLDRTDRVSWMQQGTGSQRALFWTILQVRSRLKALADIKDQSRKSITEYNKRIKKLKGEAEKAKKEGTKQDKQSEINEIEKQIAELSSVRPEEQLERQTGEFSLPGYMLLIDEPEIALHPNAIRAASRFLYQLAEDQSWQVMLATHSPLFIDPLHDHTTIVRLERSSANPSPQTYRSDSVRFSEDEKENLKILNRFDDGIAEMFFGQLPLIVEGDTEYAVFEYLINKYPDQFPISKKPVIVRARGKHTMLLVIRILAEFLVPFAVLHDADSPYRRDGKANGSWQANKDIHKAVEFIRAKGVRVVHRVSLPTFEHAYMSLSLDDNGNLLETSSKDKPWRALEELRTKSSVERSIMTLLHELTSIESVEHPFESDFAAGLDEAVSTWAEKYCPKDTRFIITDHNH